jgi:phosphatidylglycerol---prolipoprotein diacylglyceryl transferase
MHPELFKIGDFAIAWYGVLITIGVMVGALIATRLAERRGLNTNLLQDMIFWCSVWGVIGARVVYVLTSPRNFVYTSSDTFFSWFFKVVNIREGGLAIHGAVIFIVFAMMYFARKYKINFYQYIDLAVPLTALGIIGGRLGNFFNGADTIGRLTTLPIGWNWPKPGTDILGFVTERNWNGAYPACISNPELCKGQFPAFEFAGPIHLTQIYGVFIGVALVIASFYWLRSRRPGWAFWQLMLWYSLLRSGVEETFRTNPLIWKVAENNTIGYGFFTYTQLFSIPLIIIAIVMLMRIKNQPEQPWDDGSKQPNPDPRTLVTNAPAELRP